MGVKLTIPEVCDRLHISRNHWNQLVYRGQAPARIIVSARRHLVDEAVLDDWLVSRQETKASA